MILYHLVLKNYWNKSRHDYPNEGITFKEQIWRSIRIRNQYNDKRLKILLCKIRRWVWNESVIFRKESVIPKLYNKNMV